MKRPHLMPLISKLSFSILLATSFIQAVHADDTSLTFADRFKPGNAKFVLQVGGFNATQGQSQNINITGLIGDRFSVTQRNQQNVLVGLGYFIPGIIASNYQIFFGLNAFYLAPTTVKGTIYQELTYNNLSYKYKTTSYPIYIAAKGLIDTNVDNLKVTLDAGLGPNILVTSNFSESSLDGITLPDNAFSGNTNVQFSAALGAGVLFTNVYRQSSIELAYRFFYLGNDNFNKQTSQITNNLSTGNIYANALILSVLV